MELPKSNAKLEAALADSKRCLGDQDTAHRGLAAQLADAMAKRDDAVALRRRVRSANPKPETLNAFSLGILTCIVPG